ncbi:hypothetical protein CYMTET_36386, partial [Cymbomonas tetramitiformis]
GKSLMLRIQGLEYMNDDPSEVDVLYVKVEEVGGEGRLERLCEAVVDLFADEGLLLSKVKQPLATLMKW